MDSTSQYYKKRRIENWERMSQHYENPRHAGMYYHKLLQHYYKFLSSPGSRILELGCAHGDLLASLEPSLGVGVDFSGKMIERAAKKHPHLFFIHADALEIEFKEKFDVIILSDLVNDVWDVQHLFEKLYRLSHPGTRLILNFFNNLWRIPLSIVRFLGLGSEVLEQNWLSPNDVFNLLNLSGYEVIKRNQFILLPLHIPLLSAFANRYIVNFVPLSWFALTNFVVARPSPNPKRSIKQQPSVSIIIPARNESGNIESILKRTPTLGAKTEFIFVEGHSSDNTYETIENAIEKIPHNQCKVFKQPGKGKGDAVRMGFEKAENDLLMILDADMTVAPEDLTRFYQAINSGKGEFVNGVRLVYPMEDQAMRFFNIIGNKFFSIAFSWLLGQPVKDTLCGTKVLWKRDYELIAKNRNYFGNFDPFGDFDLLFGAAKSNLKIVEVPIRYRSRAYGKTNIKRWIHGRILLKMVFFAAKRIKFI